MPDEKKADDVEKLLSDQKSLEARRQTLIAELLKQKEAAGKDFDEKKQIAMREFDEKLAKLDYRANSSGKPKRSHHKKAVEPPASKQKT